MEKELKMLTLQKFLFEQSPTRRKLLDYRSDSNHKCYRIGIYRNHSFELIEHTIRAYLDYAEISAEFIYSDYDDSLSFLDLDTTTDMIILWLDLSRYHIDNRDGFLYKRVGYLESIYPNPILIVPFEGTFFYESARIVCYSLDQIKQTMGKRYLDERLEIFSGTKLSALACMAVSEQLGLRYIPALLKPAIKAIIVDLDNTLYHGVLGEDGISSLVLTSGHKHLQEALRILAKQGVFLCIASKNDERDVDALFDQRKDFPLKIDDFTKVCANWDSKVQSIIEIASFLNINYDSMIFIDDNLGEIAAVTAAFPEIKYIHALEDAETTCKIISLFPGLLRLNIQKEDVLRKKDIQANEIRQQMKHALLPEDYIRSLGMKLTFSINNPVQSTRISELANKTNQFIFSYRRYSIAEIERLMQMPDAAVITAYLSDKLSESGIIATCVALNREQYVEIDECFVSCRALGRGIDNILVLGMMQYAIEHFQCEMLKVNFVLGDRNEPAKRFIEANLLPYLDIPSQFYYKIPENLAEIKIIK